MNYAGHKCWPYVYYSDTNSTSEPSNMVA